MYIYAYICVLFITNNNSMSKNSYSCSVCYICNYKLLVVCCVIVLTVAMDSGIICRCSIIFNFILEQMVQRR